jgi:hypothetical protein
MRNSLLFLFIILAKNLEAQAPPDSTQLFYSSGKMIVQYGFWSANFKVTRSAEPDSTYGTLVKYINYWGESKYITHVDALGQTRIYIESYLLHDTLFTDSIYFSAFRKKTKEAIYWKGAIDIDSIYYSPSGNQIKEVFFENGILNGRYSEYDSLKNLEINGNYVDGKKDGTWYLGSPDNTIYELDFYKNGLLIKTEEWYEGQLIKK